MDKDLTSSHDVVRLSENCFLDLEREVLIKGELYIFFSRIEFRLLKFISRNLTTPVSSEEIIRYVWGSYGVWEKEKLYVYIHRIRKRMEDSPQQPKFLLSVHGFGYVLYPQNDIL